MEEKFMKVVLKIPMELHDKYVKQSAELGIAKSALMVLDMKKVKDEEDKK